MIRRTLQKKVVSSDVRAFLGARDDEAVPERGEERKHGAVVGLLNQPGQRVLLPDVHVTAHRARVRDSVLKHGKTTNQIIKSI